MTDVVEADTQDSIAAKELPDGVHFVSPWMRLLSTLLDSVLITVTLGIGWAIWAGITGKKGQTPAKKLLGLRAIDAQTQRPATVGKMFWGRGVLAGLLTPILIAITVGVLLFMPFWDKRRRTVVDRVSSTFVVTDPTDAWSRAVRVGRARHDGPDLGPGLLVCRACKFSSNPLDVRACRACGSENLESVVR